MMKRPGKQTPNFDEMEIQDWIESLDYVIRNRGAQRANVILDQLRAYALQRGVQIPFSANTPYINTIPLDLQPLYPGNGDIEQRIRSLVRWNALAMVVRANREESGIGGHISTYASAATLYEVGFNHFFQGRNGEKEGDIIYFQGHASPGIYARAFLEGRLDRRHLENFRRELRPEGGLSSYPHPWLMPHFWEFPTVSMGLSPIMAIYQARFNRYLEDRGLKKESEAKVWAFLGDGETDEPEALGAITLASREKLDNLIFVINCNLQRLDGPVRGNGNIIQELEAVFRGAGWNVIKAIWGRSWDPLLAADKDGVLVKRMTETLDGEWQKYSIESGAYIREHFFGTDPRLLEMVRHLSDEQIAKLGLGGHDPFKIYAAYQAAVAHKGAPSVVLARTIKGYGLGEAGEGRNITHQQKKMNEEELRHFRGRFGIPISDDEIAEAPFYRPPDDCVETQYIQERRRQLGGYMPARTDAPVYMEPLGDELFDEFYKGTEDRQVSTTMVFVRLLSKLLRDDKFGKFIVPIIPDESRTFGMEPLFRQIGIYSHVGQLYEPVDRETLLYYREALDGQILEEGITEAGSMSSFIAAGTAYATHRIPTVPFFVFYSMFGFQRVGDLIWAAADCRAKGFLVGGTSGRTTLAGEGLQHQDGHSHLLAYPLPNVKAYDPAFAFELAIIIKDGLRRMYDQLEQRFFYITVMNENYAHPPMPDGPEIEEGILRGMYKFRPAANPNAKLRAQLFGSGAILNEVLKAQEMLAEKYKVAADVWSITSYKGLHEDGIDAERWNLLHPSEPPRVPYVTQCLSGRPGVLVAASDYVRALPDSISRFFPRPLQSLGTDGFGRSDSRSALRDFFEVDARFVVVATLYALMQDKQVDAALVQQAIKDLGIDTEKPNPAIS